VVLRSKKGMEFEGLDKPHKAAKWLRYYATKLWEDGRYVLLWENPEEQKASQEKREDLADVEKSTLTQVLLMGFEAFLLAELPGLAEEDRRRLIYDASWENFFSQDPDPKPKKNPNEKHVTRVEEMPKEVQALAYHVSGLFETGQVNEAIAHAVRSELKRHNSLVSNTMGQGTPAAGEGTTRMKSTL